MAGADGASPRPLVQQSPSRRVGDRDLIERGVRSRRGVIAAVCRDGRLNQEKMSGLDARDREAEALSTLPRPPLTDGSLGGDPSAGSPTDTLFTCSPCRHGAWTVSSSGAPCAGARRAVSEGSDRVDRPSLRIVRTCAFLHTREPHMYRRILGVPRI